MFLFAISKNISIKKFVIYIYFVLLTIITTSCKRMPTIIKAVYTPEGNKTLTQVKLAETEVENTGKPYITGTATKTPWPRRTKTPTFTFSPPTNTPLPCPPFKLDTELPFPDIPSNYIGRHYDPFKLPKGLEYLGGAVLSNSLVSTEDLGISELRWNQDRKMYWLERLVCRNNTGIPYFEIIDVIVLPPLLENETLTDVCFIGNKEVGYIAIGTYDINSPIIEKDHYMGWQYKNIRFAFDLDLTVEKFVVLDPKNLMCIEDVGAGAQSP